MKTFCLLISAVFSGTVIAAGEFTIQSLPSAPEEANPVCRDVNGKLANCSPTAGVDVKYLASVAVDGDGIELGTVIDFEPQEMTIYSSKGYVFDLNADGKLAFEEKAEFSGLDCTGNRYFEEPSFSRLFHNGRVFDYSYEVPVAQPYYVPKDSVVESVELNSSYDYYFGCSNYGSPEIKPVRRAYPNNPDITGVANKGTYYGAPYTLPINLERP